MVAETHFWFSQLPQKDISISKIHTIPASLTSVVSIQNLPWDIESGTLKKPQKTTQWEVCSANFPNFAVR